MKKVRELKSWIEGYEQVTSAVGDLQVLFDFAKEGEATEEEVDVQNESDSFDTAPEEGLTDPDSFTKELGSLLFDLLDSF